MNDLYKSARHYAFAYVTATSAGLVLVILFTGILSAAFLAPNAKAPLFWTLLAHVGTAIIATFLTIKIGNLPTGPQNELAKQRSAAIYVFTNAAGTLGSLTSNFAESIEFLKPANYNGITYFLEPIFQDQPKALFAAYIVYLVFLSSLALVSIISGAKLLSETHQEDENKIRLAISDSTLILALWILVGITWDDIPFGSREAATTSSVIFYIIMFFVTAWLFSKWACSVVVCIISAAVGGITNAGKFFADPNIKRLAFFWLKIILIGLASATAALLFGVTVVVYIVDNTSEFLKSSADQVFDFYTNLFRFLFRSMIEVAIFVLAMFGLIFLRIVAQATWKSLKLVFQYAQSWAARFPGHVDAFVAKRLRDIDRIKAALSATALPRFKFSIPNANPIRIPNIAALLCPAIHPLTILAERCATIIYKNKYRLMILVAGYFIFNLPIWHSDDDKPYASTQEHTTTESAELAPREALAPKASSLPPLEAFQTSPKSICTVYPGSVDWAYGRDDKFEISVENCALNADLKTTNSAVIFVAVASTGVNAKLETNRAYDRGLSLTNFANKRLPHEVQLYLLEMGMAKTSRPYTGMSRILGYVSGERPAVATQFTPVPENSVFNSADVARELDELLRYSRASQNFTDCRLLQVERALEGEVALREVEGFNCGESSPF